MVAEQVKAAKSMNKILLSSYDTEAVELFIKEQVKIVGGSLKLYDMIERKFRQQQVIPFFVKETWDLYNWRLHFFKTYFPKGSWVTEDEDDVPSDVGFDGGLNNEDQDGDANNDGDHNGAVNEEDLDGGIHDEEDDEDANEEDDEDANEEDEVDEHYYSIMYSEITTNFEDLMIFAGRDSFENIVFFRKDVEEGEVFNVYDRDNIRFIFEDQVFLHPWFMVFSDSPFSIFVHMAVELYPKGPKTLEELAMKAVLKKDGFLDREVYGQVLWEKSVLGLYAPGLYHMGPKTLKSLALKAVIDLDLEDYAQVLPEMSRVGLYASGRNLPQHVSESGTMYLETLRDVFIKYGGKKMIFDKKKRIWKFFGDA